MSLHTSSPRIKAVHRDSADPIRCPTVTICTLTHNRSSHLVGLRQCVAAQDYPLGKIEWLILDDSNDYTHNLLIEPIPGVTIKYQRLRKKLILGSKRNLAHKLCSGDYIVYMDDDDFYPSSRVRHAVQTLYCSGLSMAGCTVLPIYFADLGQMWLSGPFGAKHATAATFAMTREFAQSNLYDPQASCNEEKDFLKDYSIPIAQLDPLKTMICISHNSNTFDKRRMIVNGATPRMRLVEIRNLGALGEEFLGSGYPKKG